ncbi:MAG: 5'/3'-nucleotidase SurE, partial [Microcystis sp.]
IPTLLNVNVPPVSSAEIKGVKITRQGLRRYEETFEKRLDPRGKSYYWLIGEVVEDIEQPDYSHLPPQVPTDVRAIGENFITITPLQYNLTDVQGFQHLHGNSWFD